MSAGVSQQDAIDIAHAALVRKVLSRWPGMLDEEEARQDLALYVLEHLHGWSPERGALSTYVHVLFGQWWRNDITKRRWRARREITFDPIEVRDAEGNLTLAGQLISESSDSTERHEVSELAEVLLGLLPEDTREVAELHYGYGVSRSAVAEMTGLPEPTVNYRCRKARKIWRECWERDEAA